MEDRRKCPRETTPYTALYCSLNGVRAVKLKDLSRTGAAVVFKDPVPAKMHEVVLMHFFSRDLNKLITKLRCKVIRVFQENEHYAIGIAFIDPDPEINEIMAYLRIINSRKTG